MRTLFRPVKVVAWVYSDPDMVVFRLDRTWAWRRSVSGAATRAGRARP